MAIATALIGFGALLNGSFSRFGLWRQVGLAVGLVVVVQGIDSLATAAALTTAGGWILAYLPPLVGLGIGVGLLAWSQRPRRVARPAAERAA